MQYSVNRNKTLPTMAFDNRLDWKSKGVLAVLYSLEGIQDPQESDQIISLVTSCGNSGATSVKTAFQELIRLGYLIKVSGK